MWETHGSFKPSKLEVNAFWNYVVFFKPHARQTVINCAVILAMLGEFVGGKVNQTGSDLHAQVIILM